MEEPAGIGLVYCHKCHGRRDNDQKCLKVAGMTWNQLKESYAPRRFQIWGAAGPPSYTHIPAKVGERDEQTYRGRQRGEKKVHDRTLDRKAVTAETWLPKIDKRRKAYKESRKEEPEAKRRHIERSKQSRPRVDAGDEAPTPKRNRLRVPGAVQGGLASSPASSA